MALKKIPLNQWRSIFSLPPKKICTEIADFAIVNLSSQAWATFSSLFLEVAHEPSEAKGNCLQIKIMVVNQTLDLSS